MTTTATPTTTPATEPTGPADGTLEQLLSVPPALLQPSPTNPRKHWNPARVAEIADSMRQVGQIQPIRARTNPEYREGNGRPPYEIVVGETRWRAATLAALPTMSVVLREYTDMEVLEVQLVENLQRADLHPMEEAEAFDGLLRKPNGLQGYASVAELAARVGKSPSYVYQRLKLLNLCPAGRDAFFDGHLDAGVALLIARMPSAEEQARATARIVAGWNGEPYSFRSAAEYLQKEYMLRLSHARFDVEDHYKVAGPCGRCPKRSGAEPQLFADVAAGTDMCQDARCYQAKTEEAHQGLLATARDAGHTVLQGRAATAVLPSPGATPIGHYLLDATCPALTDSARTLRMLLGNGHTVPVVLVDLPGAAPVELVSVEHARAAIKARGLLRQQTVGGAPSKPTKPPAATKAASTSVPASPEPTTPTTAAAGATPNSTPTPAEQLASPQAGEGGAGDDWPGAWWRAQEEADKNAPLAALPPEHQKAEIAAKAGELLASAINQALTAAQELPLLGLQVAVSAAVRKLSVDALALLCTVRGWPQPLNPDAARRMIDRRVADASGRELGELLTVLQVVEQLSTMPNNEHDLDWDLVDITRELGLDVHRIWAHAAIAAAAARPSSVAGPARQEPTATEVFVAQHAGAAPEALPEQFDKKAPTDDHA